MNQPLNFHDIDLDEPLLIEGHLFEWRPEPLLDERLLENMRCITSSNAGAFHTLLEALRASPAREVGGGALQNVIARFFSRKNGDHRYLESHTIEAQLAYELELDKTVIAYWTQVRFGGIRRKDRNGKSRTDALTFDFVVLRDNVLEIIECKGTSWLESQKNTQFQFDGKTWGSPSIDAWASGLGLKFTVYAVEPGNGPYLKNLEMLYEICKHERGNDTSNRSQEKIRKLVSRRACTISEVMSSIPDLTLRDIIHAINAKLVYAPLKQVPLDSIDACMLFHSHAQAAGLESQIRAARPVTDAPLQFNDPLLSASVAQVALAKERLNKFKEIEKGGRASRKIRAAYHQYKRSKESGLSDLGAAMTKHSKSGNRTPRHEARALRVLSSYITRHQRGRYATKHDAFLVYSKVAQRLGCSVVGKTKFYGSLKECGTAARALFTGGLRAYQAQRPRTDSQLRSMRSAIFGYAIHIDSTPLDIKVDAESIFDAQSDRPTVYVGCDSATGKPVGDAFVFGSARTDGLAILMRDIVKRMEGLPAIIYIDRGPECKSHWLRKFCELEGISLKHPPTAGSRYNSPVEALHNHLQIQVVHKLSGNMLNDKAGRAVDGRFKSRKAKKHAFTTIVEEIRRYLYDDFANTPNLDDETPNERYARCVDLGLTLTRKREIDSHLLLMTSLVTPKLNVATERDGFRLYGVRFTGTAMQRALRSSPISEIREDCSNPAIAYAKIGGQWFVATSARSLTQRGFSPDQLLFDLLERPERNQSARKRKDEKSVSRVLRLGQKNNQLAAAPFIVAASTSAGADTSISASSALERTPSTELTDKEWQVIEVIA